MASAAGEDLTGFAKRAKLSRATLYAAFKREERVGSHRIDQATAEALALAGGRSVSWVLGEREGQQKLVPPENWYDEAMTILVRRGVHASEARQILDSLLDQSTEALHRQVADELEHQRKAKRTVPARVRRHEP